MKGSCARAPSSLAILGLFAFALHASSRSCSLVDGPDGYEGGAGAEQGEGEHGAEAVQVNIDTNGSLNIGVLDKFTGTNNQIISSIMKGHSSQSRIAHRMCEAEKFENKDYVIRDKTEGNLGSLCLVKRNTLNPKMIEEKFPP
ncbi:unnamed protein product [Polarella glacialis]|uniref:Uncharacterized protein n=1 Tax=Polarella glacialis TaxID=89957 RepID=A0A813DG98_POLGL|nr:unnamed protein product [Polarella glacialis]